MNIKQTIAFYNEIYYKSLDIAQLTEGKKQLQTIIQSNVATEENQLRADGLYYRIVAKIVALEYYDGGYFDEQFDNLVATLNQGLEEMQQKDYPKTKDIYQALLFVTPIVHEIVKDIGSLIAPIQDENGNCICQEGDKLEYVYSILVGKKQTLQQNLQQDLCVFPQNVNMFDVKQRVIDDLDNLINWFDKHIQAISGKQAEQFVKDNFEQLPNIDCPLVAYTQTFPIGSQNPARTILLYSPLAEEINLYVKAFATTTGKTFLRVNAHAFDGYDNSFIHQVFQTLSSKKLNLAVFGLPSYYKSNKTCLIKEILTYSKQDYYVLVVNSVGTLADYDEFSNVAKTTQGLSLLDVAKVYLTMPPLSLVLDVFTQKNIASQADVTAIKNDLTYMGYVGLNKSIHLFTNGKPWRDQAVRISLENAGRISEYLLNIPSQEQFVGRDWIDLGLADNGVTNRNDFDYDQVRNVKAQNIEKIMQADVSMFAKCGLIVRYCTLGGDDFSIWQTLTLDERQDRLNSATKLLAHVLQCEYAPEVTITPKNQWKYGDSGGICIGGGKRIEYRGDCTEDYEWTIDAICHEVYHSFQHTVENYGWKKWHATLLHVTSSRPAVWKYNFQRYIQPEENETYYMCQVTEADARAFANDCIAESASQRHLITLN